MREKSEKISQQCLHDKIVKQADDYLDEIDKVLGENTWDGPRPRLRRPRRERLGTTQPPQSDLSS